ncbi:MAG: DUF1449 family protein [Acinetobacter sp.]|nr:DUF1449 family protein [Acinetobacter sp.]
MSFLLYPPFSFLHIVSVVTFALWLLSKTTFSQADKQANHWQSAAHCFVLYLSYMCLVAYVLQAISYVLQAHFMSFTANILLSAVGALGMTALSIIHLKRVMPTTEQTSSLYHRHIVGKIAIIQSASVRSGVLGWATFRHADGTLQRVQVQAETGELLQGMQVQIIQIAPKDVQTANDVYIVREVVDVIPTR